MMISGLKSSTSTWFEAYAALSTSIMILQTATNQLLPARLRSFIFSILKRFFSGYFVSHVTLTIDELWEDCQNELYDAAQEYLPSKITDANKNLRVGNVKRNDKIAVAVQDGEAVEDVFDNIKLTWRFCVQEDRRGEQQNHNIKPDVTRTYQLTFCEKDRGKVMDSYLPHVLSAYRAIKQGRKAMKIYNRVNRSRWTSLALKHPSTFDTLAIEPQLKKGIIDDLDRFLRRKDFYKKVGKPWKRGYLLYGPPGTGKSSMIAAMANYLKFDVYNLDLTIFFSDSELIEALRTTSSRSIIVVEDIDCNKVVHHRSKEADEDPKFVKVTCVDQKTIN